MCYGCAAMAAFDTLPLRPALLEALALIDYTQMTPIQEAALPAILEGRDLTGQAKTGSGKTAAFGLGILQAIDPDELATQALVICPTRELASQVADELRRLARRLSNTRVITVTGGTSKRDQRLALERGAQVVVGTPGRLNDHLRGGQLGLSALRVLVLDEGDRLLEMGFLEEVNVLIQSCPRKRQSMLFSATFPPAIDKLSRRVQREAEFVSVESQVEAEVLRQRVYECSPDERQQLVADLLAAERPSACLVFCETRDDCEDLGAFLFRAGASVLCLHGQMEQRDRADVLLQLGNGSACVVVATNVAARGLDIPALPLVIVSELSRQPEDHLHRIGRTGRAGEPGLALTIVASVSEQRRLNGVEDFMGAPIERSPNPPASRGLDFLEPANQTLLLHAGRKQKLRKGDVLGALIKDCGLPKEAIGRIDLLDKACAVAIERRHARRALRFVQQSRIKNSRVRGTLL